VHHALNLPLFGPLSEPAAVVEIAQCAEEHGWDAVFVWDHVLSPLPEPWDIADPWIVLAAVAAHTHRIRLGPMVTPLPRRRLITLARQTVTLDHLSRGRLTLGLGLGGDSGRELSAFGEITDARVRAQGLDEGADLLVRLWSGERVRHAGFFVVDDVAITPAPLQSPRIPMWFAAKGDAQGPARRAARFDGLFPFEVDTDQLARMIDTVRAERGNLDDFDIAVAMHRGVDLDAFQALGATWAMHSFWPGHRPDQVLRFLARGTPDA
jgi:alkanesulfonate monooxygenase SsuD/methylene tetrahydromethanopterin reductase-like flavin-dependent oxidoreductase (luciferase family)